MSNTILIHNGLICNEEKTFKGYVAISGDRIEKVGEGEIPADSHFLSGKVIDARGGIVMPGVIDDQVHFREPGLTEKGDIYTESRAAVAGGVTSFMEMPNTRPPAVTLELLEEKYDRAAQVSPANYSFYLGATNENIDQIEKIDSRKVCGVKVFMGSSTGNMLVDDQDALAAIFRSSPVILAAHCEQEAIIRANMAAAIAEFGDNVPIEMHPVIRSAEACYASSAKAVELAHKYGTRLHILHLSTARELELFENKPLSQKKVTNEVCVHHLWFTDSDYASKGNLIKWNPAIKSAADRQALRDGITRGLVDVVATDHAPHTWDEKMQPYLKAPSGGPLVQHSLALMLEMAGQGIFTPQQVCRKMCHAPADLFNVEKRGYLREGYFADVVILSKEAWDVSKGNILYKCGWSPFEGQSLSWKVTHTIVNGEMAYENGEVNSAVRGRRLTFDR